MTRAETYYSEDRTKHCVLSLQQDIFVVEFFQNNISLGEIAYAGRSVHYAKDAATNYTQGILTREMVEYYQKSPIFWHKSVDSHELL